MAGYRRRRIEDIKAYVIETYKGLPKECRKMSMQEFSDFLDARAKRLVSSYEKPADAKKKIDYEQLRKETAKSFDFFNLKKSIDTLVDIDTLDFDESFSLEVIMKIIKGKGTIRVKM
ncbi:hypothetical protein HYT92_02845 [Candidatus Pacearchaeota archaeon]|nr:hypothetical protein [Candidatus Pacearchaeota archaeon]